MDITSIFQNINNDTNNILIKETFYDFAIEVNINSFYKLNSNFINSVLNIISPRDTVFSFSLTYNDSIEIELEDNDINKFVNVTDDYIAISDSEITTTKLKIQVNKSLTDTYISIYSLVDFGKYLYALKASTLLTILANKAKLGFITFEIIDSNLNYTVNSPSIAFTGSSVLFTKHKIVDNSLITSFKSVCNFQSNLDYSFTPNDFLINESISSEINLVFNNLKIIYSLIYIFDTSNLSNNFLTLNLNGCKCLEIKINLETINYSDLNIYYDIYNWLYTDGNINDKIGITRNVLSLYLKACDSIELDYSAFTAIQSNYAIYLKENVEKYLDVKSKIIDTLLATNTQISKLVESLTGNFIKNLGAIGTFIITLTVMKSLDDKKFENIFTYDMIVISFFLVLASVVYLKYTIKEYIYNKNRIEKLYKRLKLSYKDILVPKDIETIFNKDKYFNEDIESADEKVTEYKKLWCIILLLFEIAVIVLGFFLKP